MLHMLIKVVQLSATQELIEIFVLANHFVLCQDVEVDSKILLPFLIELAAVLLIEVVYLILQGMLVGKLR